ncbi:MULTISPECIES: STAS domain-containing protein [Priestia]|jgi:rsbT co-antagonist protein RsbR|uniref:STAS domain-containing protein n=1 Tax=Priestia flexa TaxID=86664 RepID=A0A1N6V4Q7_9BACI|nr:STAS domain-containing protein [Priestia flexa]MBN8251238.1 STAS domain-containing protein [Priestia flexa]MBN8434499.1 STAS domain-containing protein [Priestia flexa]MBY6086501.1 STAS domain-containing protein [Priestia flexa]MCA0966715.1 STAS domain-containing protein [Priestia flexa]MCA1202546.1 STAS domain-containing protein [Priestia flexa]
MHRNHKLYHFLVERTWSLTENWYESLDKENSLGVYASNDPLVIDKVKQQNHEFHIRFCKVFDNNESSEQFSIHFDEWINSISKDEEHLNTPIDVILHEFFVTQNQYLDLIEEFVRTSSETYSQETINRWNRVVIKNFNYVMTVFTREYHAHSQLRLKAQQELIIELSSPIISLSSSLALLPIVGEIDTDRARFILENTLNQCVDKGIRHLLLDLSGVVIIDTMVAHQIFQLIESLSLIGVKATLSGIRPEIAQTAIQIGIDFSKISIVSSLEQAIATSKTY